MAEDFKILTVTDAVERNPKLYDAMRERDSAANRVCELMSRGQNYRPALGKWKIAAGAVKAEYSRACEAAAREPADVVTEDTEDGDEQEEEASDDETKRT